MFHTDIENPSTGVDAGERHRPDNLSHPFQKFPIKITTCRTVHEKIMVRRFLTFFPKNFLILPKNYWVSKKKKKGHDLKQLVAPCFH